MDWGSGAAARMGGGGRRPTVSEATRSKPAIGPELKGDQLAQLAQNRGSGLNKSIP
jgi:hypothetical protein